MLAARALEGLPEIVTGDDLAAILAQAMPDGSPAATEVLVIAHKVVSKAEGRTRRLSAVTPTPRAEGLATLLGKDPRHVQVVLDETREVRRAAHGVLIAVTHHGFVCANAGVDASNAPDDDTVILLPTDPDRSARHIRDRLRALTGRAPAVLITDSFGRAWRHGQCDVAIGAAGLRPLEDWRGRTDAYGRVLKATWIAVADQLAGAADLARAKDARQPAILITGADRHVMDKDGPGAGALLRDPAHDLFR
ncbi:MAG: coenzyme F420-0:L-glutamate ligase / coenzyme F420:gamma-L-glutamate ligase [Solirubrobacteraceae bacterium]|jgi:coenzyme F420-0:L-glutamate ligase/coenzyme F420-1:gamma-L-glutamate ligase|nr:coenzyme F420-0:L-glutamate ligase / coenzyme F420:gamma-L-glutamate ligase [Solirubrobacteraceae bacterium]